MHALKGCEIQEENIKPTELVNNPYHTLQTDNKGDTKKSCVFQQLPMRQEKKEKLKSCMVNKIDAKNFDKIIARCIK